MNYNNCVKCDSDVSYIPPDIEYCREYMCPLRHNCGNEDCSEGDTVVFINETRT